jgi:hypothetical protein
MIYIKIRFIIKIIVRKTEKETSDRQVSNVKFNLTKYNLFI